MPPERDIHVEIAGCAPRLAGPAGLRLAAGARLANVLEALDIGPEQPMRFGIWGRKAAPDTPLRDGDRIEFYRPLTADPKAARRARAKR